MYWFLLISLLLALPSSPVAAAEISQEDYNYFKEESFSQYGGELDATDIEDKFYEIAVRTESPDEALTEFSEALGVSAEVAQQYVLALVEAVRYREACGNNRDHRSCRIEAGTTLYDALVGAGFDDQSGRLAVSIGKATSNYTDEQRSARSSYIRVIYDHPARSSIYSKLYDYGRDIEFAAVLAATEPAGVESAVIYRDEAEDYSACEASQYGSFLALLRLAQQNAADDEIDRSSFLILTEALIWSQLRFGLVSEAVQNFSNHADEVREHLSGTPPEFLDADEQLEFVRQNANFLLEIAYAMYSLADLDGARDSLDFREGILSASGVQSKSDAALAAALRETMSPSLSADELYDMAIYGRIQEDTASRQNNKIDRFDDDRWLFAISESSMLVRSVFAERLRDAGYFGMANYLSHDTFYGCYDTYDPLTAIEDLLPESFAENRSNWADQVDRASHSIFPTNLIANEGISVIEPQSRPLVIQEHKLPSDLVRLPQPETEGDEEYGERNLIPENVYVPVEPSSVVRYSEEDGERHIVYLSSAIDRPGEIPAYGFWYQSSRNHGQNWSAPLYLGIQQFFPYVVVPDSRLPLLADGKLQIEVEVKEIDPASITFPPVGLGLKREERNLYISIDLDDLRRDRDGDYMTDVIEHRLGLDPANPDTDGDDIPDGIDSLPLTAYDSNAPREETELAYAILETIHGYERAALMVQPPDKHEDVDVLTGLELPSPRKFEANSIYLVADPRIFAGIYSEDLLLVYTEDEIERISDGQAPFYPAKVSHIFRKGNGREFYVIWSASWTGGEFIVTCSDDECTVVETSRWIT